MCTLLIATRVWQDAPLVVAANRDEKLGRPSEPPSVREASGMQFLAPRDLQSGGTWLGINQHGVLAAITNRWTPSPRDDVRSRGLLVVDALRPSTAVQSADAIAALDPSDYNPFHLVVAGADAAFLLWSDGHGIRRETLAPGIHVLTERSLGAAPSKRLELLHAKIGELFGPTLPEPEAWAELLRTKAEPAIEGVCILDPDRDYGTRSSSIVVLEPDASQSLFMHANGPPDSTPYDDLSSQLRELLT